MAKHRSILFAAPLLLAIWAGQPVREADAEVFVLKSGGRIEGEHLNPQREPGQPYHVRTEEGLRLALAESAVQRVVTKSDVQKQYEEMLRSTPNTAAGHWTLAEWCKEVGLTDERKRQLQDVIALEPNHEEARKALGYQLHAGRWLTADENMLSQGYVRYKGAWRTRQEVEIEARERQWELAVKKWRQDIRRWFEQIVTGSRNAEAADRELASIQDPAAAVALADILSDGRQPPAVRGRCLDILAKLSPGLATGTLINLALDDADENIRDRCIDEIRRGGSQAALRRFVHELENKDNARVNRAGQCLARLGDKDATLALIQALVTEHKFVVPSGGGGGGGGGMPLSFSAGGGPGQGGLGSFGVGGKPKVEKHRLQNDGVRDALATLYPGVNYQFDVDAWKKWYIHNLTSTNVDLRRDE
jgi:hypothetical protein